MIVSCINEITTEHQYPAAIEKALDYLRNNDLLHCEAGTRSIEGDMIFAQIHDIPAKPAQECRSEFHKKYIDLQYWPDSQEMVGVAFATEPIIPVESHDDRDLYFCKTPETEKFFHAVPGTFMVFFPGDIHRPGIAEGKIGQIYRKIVIKISLNAIQENKQCE